MSRLHATLSWVEFFIPDALRQRSAEEHRRAQVGVAFAAALAVWGPIYATLMGILFGTWHTSIAILVCTVTVISGPLMLRKIPHTAWLGNWTAGNLFWLMGYVAWFNGGHGGPSLMWLVAVPLFAMITAGNLSGLLWGIASLGMVGGFYFADQTGTVFPQELDPGQFAFFDTTVLMGLVVLIAVLSMVFDSITRWAMNEVQEREAQAVQMVLDYLRTRPA